MLFKISFKKLSLVATIFILTITAVACQSPPATKNAPEQKKTKPPPTSKKIKKEIIFFTLTNVKKGVGFYPHYLEPESNVKTSLYALDPQSQQVYRLVNVPRANHPALMPDGRYLFYIWEGGGPRGADLLQSLDLKLKKDGWPPMAGSTEDIIPWWLAFDPSGKQLAYVSYREEKGVVKEVYPLNKIYLFNLKTGKNTLLAKFTPPDFLEANTRLDSLRWSPQGNYLAFEAVSLHTDVFLSPLFTIKSDGRNIRRVAKMGRSPAWDPKEERLYYLVPAVQEEGEPFDPNLPAYIKSTSPTGGNTRIEASFKASEGLGTALAIGEKNFYFTASSNPEEENLDLIVALKRKKKAKKVLFKAPAGYWIHDLIVARTPYLNQLKQMAEQGEATQNQETETDKDFSFNPSEGGQAEVSVLKDIRFGQQEKFERVVVEFTPQKNNPDPRVPRYRSRFGALPFQDIEGNDIPLEGSYFFELTYGANVADLSGDTPKIVYQGPREFKPGYTLIKEAKFVNAYESNTLILVIGLAKKAPFRVSELLNPPRIVIDFKKGGG